MKCTTGILADLQDAAVLVAEAEDGDEGVAVVAVDVEDVVVSGVARSSLISLSSVTICAVYDGGMADANHAGAEVASSAS